VSKIKLPQEKKTASLENDCRNTYGENDKSSRKNIPLNKQRSHQAERRASNQPLQRLSGVTDEDAAVAAEIQSRTEGIEKKRKAFRKFPDTPLKDVLVYQETGKLPGTPRFFH
jgi:hypothetical protein